jgi:putative CocE/NonD family hydrolase
MIARRLRWPVLLGAMSPIAGFCADAIVSEYNAMVSMRDGVRLSTDVHRPAAPGRYPVLLVRDIYDNGSESHWTALGRKWAERGYAFVHQDVRGRMDSEGEFYPYMSEPLDGFDAQQWVARQPWSSGKVGTLGGSYLASTQWLSAPLRSPALAAIVPKMTPFNYYKDVAYVGGALSLSSRIGWASSIGGRTNQDPQVDWNRVLHHLPLKSMDTVLGMNLPHWRDWIAHPAYDEYWKRVDVESRLPDIDVPSYSIAGWYDVFLRGNLVSFAGMRSGARSEAARRGQKLLVGPWPHTDRPKERLGDLDFGPGAVVDFDALHRRWLDHWLKGEDTGFLTEPPVCLFVMGRNAWRAEQEWPLARTVYTKFYLQEGSRLGRERPTRADSFERYVYDPRDPVPTRGGNLMFQGTPAGPFEQGRVGDRPDVRVFVTARLEEDLEVTGPVTVTLYAASSARDTDFTAKLLDVHPDGKAYNLVDGIIRARYRKSFAQPQLLEPGRVYEYTIDLWATSNVFKKGHRIRLDVSSSNFPRFDRNPNTGHAFGQDAELQSATQVIHLSRRYPSNVVLPVIPVRPGAPESSGPACSAE